MMFSAKRSLTEPPGLKASALTKTFTCFGAIRLMRIAGVSPMVSRILSYRLPRPWVVFGWKSFQDCPKIAIVFQNLKLFARSKGNCSKMPALAPTEFYATVTWLGTVPAEKDSIRAIPLDSLDLTFAGIPGERHAGLTR